MVNGWDARQAMMAAASRVEALLHGAVSDDAVVEDHGESSVPAGIVYV